nr:uncharacterized protein LOC104117024 isoform X2 [Nicotiana tomentosiformis]
MDVCGARYLQDKKYRQATTAAGSGIFKTRSTGKPLQLLAQVSSRQEVQASHYSCWLRYLQDKKYRQATTAAGSVEACRKKRLLVGLKVKILITGEVSNLEISGFSCNWILTGML